MRIDLNTVRKTTAFLFPYFIRKFIPRSISMHLYFRGRFEARLRGQRLLQLNANGYQIENDIFWYGLENAHEKKSLEIFMDFCNTYKPKTVFDIGANTGLYGLVALSLEPQCKVSFFEPIPFACEVIKKNLKSNCYSANVFQLALSNYSGHGVINMGFGKDMEYSVTLNSFADQAITGNHDFSIKYQELKVEVDTVANLIESGQIGLPQLIKIDVEAHESEVLSGFGSYISNSMAFLVEVLNENEALKLNNIFQGRSFEFWNIDDLHGRVRRSDTIEKSDYYNYFICSHQVGVELKSLRNW